MSWPTDAVSGAATANDAEPKRGIEEKMDHSDYRALVANDRGVPGMLRLGPINRRELEDLLVTYARLGARRIRDEEIRKYAELIVDLVKMRGVV